MSALGPWQDQGVIHTRRDAGGKAGAIVFAPGDGGRWGWFVINEHGESRATVGAKRGGSEEEAKALADAAARELGMVLS